MKIFGQTKCAIINFFIERLTGSHMKAHDLMILKLALVSESVKNFLKYQNLKICENAPSTDRFWK